MSRFMLILVFVLVGPMARADQAVMAQMAGKWYGAIGDQGLRYEWLTEDRPDGTVRIHFHDCQSGEESVEVGTWYMSGSLYVTQTVLEGDSVSTAFTNSYLVEERTQDHFRYRHIGTGIVFEARRMAPDFELPGCDVTS